MNTKLYNIYGIICIFPVWIFKSNLENIDLLTLFLFFTILPIFIHILFLKFHTRKQSNIIYIWLSLITFYSIDQNLGLWNFSQDFQFILNFRHFGRSVYFSILSILFLNLIFFLLKQNALKILLSFVLVIFIFNIFDQNKNFSNFPKVDLSANYQKNNKNHLNKKVVLIFDEMSGLNDIYSNYANGDRINEYIIDFFSKNKFDIYINAFSLFKNTEKSVSSVFNFIKSKQEYTEIIKTRDVNFVKKSNNYFIVNDLIKNKFFDLKESQNIVVQQSMYLNFCDHPKVIICNQFNPFNKDLTFLKGFKNTKFTKYVSLYRNNGSILSRLSWRLLLHFRAIDTMLDPDGEKASIRYIFQQLFEDIKNNKNSSLFFSHIMVPHIPYAFKKNCEYDGSKTTNFNSLSIEQKIIQHNLEKYCLIYYLDEFLKKLIEVSEFKNLEIIIFSDHDSRLDASQIKNNVIFVHKKRGSKKSSIINDDVSINKLFYNLNIN